MSTIVPALVVPTNVTATLVDSNGVTWANATVVITLAMPPNATGPILWNDAPFQIQYRLFSDTNGFFQVDLPDNLAITPRNTSWHFSIASAVDNSVSVQFNVIFSTFAQDISASFTFQSESQVPRLVQSLPLPRAADASQVAIAPNDGQVYYNTTDKEINVWESGQWVPVAGGGGGGALIQPTTNILRGDGTGNAVGTALTEADIATTTLVSTSIATAITPIDTRTTNLETRATDLENDRVLRAGDTMTGALIINSAASPALNVGSPSSFTVNGSNGSVAHGAGSSASAPSSYAGGINCNSGGQASHTEGNACTTGIGAMNGHAEGSNSSAWQNSAHAEGWNTSAGALGAHTEGSNTSCSGGAGHAEGSGCVVTATNGHAQGQNTQATGINSSSGGFITTAAGAVETVIGMANVPSADTPTANFGTPWDLVPLYTNSSNLFTIGNGTSNITGPTSSPSNAFVVDVWGNTQTNRLTISGPNTGLPVGQTASVPNGISATTTGTTNTIGATAANSVTIGSWNNVSGENSIVTGIANNNLSGGQHCIMAGITNRTESPGAIAVGINAWATAAWSHAFGGGPTADPCLAMGGYSGAAGHGITASGFAENVVGVFNVPFFNPFPPTTPPETIPIHTTAQNLFTIGNGSGGGTFPPGWLIGSPGISQRSNAFCVDALARTYVTRLIVGDRTKTGTPAFQQNPNPVDPPNDDMIPLAQTPAGIECATLLPFPNNAAAIAGGLTVGSFYRTGGDPDLVCVVH